MSKQVTIAAPALEALSTRLGVNWPQIATARRQAGLELTKLEELLGDEPPVDTSLVVFGSLARGEFTQGSDIDWTLLVDGQAAPSHLRPALTIEKRIAEHEMRKPGREGTFGGLAFSHDLVHYIGGGDDSNRNTTQRILLLLESRPIGDRLAYDRVRTQVLKRYVEEDFGLVHGNNPSNVPRFLQNDIARYWRTVAVDFAYKRREREAKGWALRTVKLRLSRKLTYASGLAACFSCASLKFGQEGRDPDSRALATVDHLSRLLQQSPLEILAQVLEPHIADPKIRKAAGDLFGAYDAFLGILADKSKRDMLETLLPDDAPTSSLYGEARSLGHRFQDALNSIFLTPNPTGLYEQTCTYGVF